MNRSRSRVLLAAGAVGLGIVAAAAGSAWAGEWVHRGGDTLGQGRATGAGAISSAPDKLPAVSWSVALSGEEFGASHFADVDADGQLDIVTVHQERVAAFDASTFDLIWQSQALGIGSIWGFADTDGDGEDDEIIATSWYMGGGLAVVDAGSGATLWSYSGLGGGSGVGKEEMAVGDIDGDGADEILFAAQMNGDGSLYLVDLSTGDARERIVTAALQGTYLNFTRTVMGDFDGDGLRSEIATFHGADLGLKRLCSSLETGAVCDDYDQSVCLCDQVLLEGVFPTTFVPPAPEAIDVDLDGDEDLVFVSTLGSVSLVAGALGLDEAFASGTPGEASGWMRNYADSSGGEDAIPLYSGPPVADLDGDGNLEFVYTVRNAGEDEVDGDGAVFSDGLNAPGALGVVVLDAATGTPVVSVADRYLYGLVDGTGDGLPELLVGETDGWAYPETNVEGQQLTCAPTCSLDTPWSVDGYGVARGADVLDGLGYPSPVVPLSQPDSSTVQGLLLWQGQTLVRWDFGPSGVIAAGPSLVLDAETAVAGSDPLGRLLVTNLGGVLTAYDSDLAVFGGPEPVEGVGTGSWLAGVLDSVGVRAVPILDGAVFDTVAAPSSLGQADATLLDTMLLIQDVDGDQLGDVFTSHYESSTGVLRVARHEYLSSGSFSAVWEWSSEATDLEGLAVLYGWSVTAEELTGDAVEDLILEIGYRGTRHLIALNGASGQLGWQPSSPRNVWYGPLLAQDLAADGVYGTTDGVIDVFRPTTRHHEVLEWGDIEPSFVEANTNYSSHFPMGDLDGDGDVEAVVGRLYGVSDPFIEAWGLGGTAPTLLWGPETNIGTSPYVEQALALGPMNETDGMDVVFISSSGRIGVLDGATGSVEGTDPTYLAGGTLATAAPANPEALTAVILVDIDGDGYTEAVAGGRTGWLYAINLSALEGSAPTLEWSYFVGAPVSYIASADVDGDGADELLLSTPDGTARVVDGLGVALSIASPTPTDCVAGATTEIQGDSANVDSVSLRVLGAQVAQNIVPDENGLWSAAIPIPLVYGVVEVVAVGIRDGVEAAAAQVLVTSQADSDDDGVTLCGGDCEPDDGEVAPGLEEVCDGKDNDCDSATDETVDGDTDGASLCEGDCDDSNAAVGVSQAEVCEGDLDEDCDGLVDLADPDCDSSGDDDDSSAGPGDDDDAGGDDDDSVGGGGDSTAEAGGCGGCDAPGSCGEGCAHGGTGGSGGGGLWFWLGWAGLWLRRLRIRPG